MDSTCDTSVAIGINVASSLTGSVWPHPMAMAASGTIADVIAACNGADIAHGIVAAASSCDANDPTGGGNCPNGVC